ncbi:MAG: tetratricopeptide repeat protein [Pyrinomonadaceae bacterium]
MQKNTLLFVIAAALGGFIGGFMLANSMNRSEMTSLRSQATQPAANSTGQPSNSAATTLSPEEIQAKIDEADQNADDFAFQKSLGIGLYRYAAMSQDVKTLGEAERILIRAGRLNPRDFDVFVALGNAEFDIAFFNRDSAKFAAARATYQKALEIKPGDLDVQTDLALTYFLPEPPDNEKAAGALEKVIAADPKHSRSMGFLAQTYLRLGKIADAEKMLAKLKELDPKSELIADIEKQITSANALTQ